MTLCLTLVVGLWAPGPAGAQDLGERRDEPPAGAPEPSTPDAETAPSAEEPVGAPSVAPPVGEPATETPPTEAASAANDNNDAIMGVQMDALPGDPWGDTTGDIAIGPMSMRLLMQTRYTATFAQPSENPRPSYRLREDLLAQRGDGWALERAFLRVAIQTDRLAARLILDFAELVVDDPEGVVKQAYATYRAIPKRFELTAGLFKLPYSILELDPIRKLEFADNGQLNDLTRRLGFGGRDIGAQILIAPLRKPRHLRMWFGVYRGNSRNENDSPLGAVGGRIESRPTKRLRLGADALVFPWERTYLRPFTISRRNVLPDPPDPLFPTQQRFDRGAAASADVTFQHAGWMLRGEGMIGNRVDVFTRDDARTFMGAWGILAYRFPVSTVRVMPAVRLEWLDADRENPGGQRLSLSGGLTVLTSKTTRLLFDATHTWVEPGSPLFRQPRPLADPLYLELERTRIVGQFQVEF
jgi:hypothetical protein